MEKKKNISKRKRPYFNFGIGNYVVKSMWEKSIWKRKGHIEMEESILNFALETRL